MSVALQEAPAGDPATHTADLKELYADLGRRGMLEPSHFWHLKLLFWTPTFLLSYLGLVALPFGPLWLLLAPLAAVALLTMGFVGHDAGHYALSKRRWVNDVWGQLGMTLLCGMSFGFWRSRHNEHHVHCQEIDGDPDMHFGVLFSVYPELGQLAAPRSDACSCASRSGRSGRWRRSTGSRSATTRSAICSSARRRPRSIAS